MNSISTRRATIEDADAIAEMAHALLTEIMAAIGTKAFDSNPMAKRDQLRHSIPSEQQFVLMAEKEGIPVGFAALSPAYSLYTNGPFGLLTELFVLPDHRSQSVGERLVLECKEFAMAKGWTQLEVTTPPLPQFHRTLKFYETHEFVITGGRKLKLATTQNVG